MELQEKEAQKDLMHWQERKKGGNFSNRDSVRDPNPI